ncbi:MAG: hypothetical protein IJH83_07605 [Coriobacteriales bacterium]|nr:hypothetical protein [Coriobacteriales bacterium]
MLYLLTGGRQSGKTTWLKGLMTAARERGLRLDGLVTPAVFEDDRKVAIDALLLPDGITLRLADWQKPVFTAGADAAAGEHRSATAMPWKFHAATVDAVNTHFAAYTPDAPAPGFLLVDELGWMEFNDNGGYVEAMRVLDQHAFAGDALAVIRPELLQAAVARWTPIMGGSGIRVIEPDAPLPF